MQKIESSQNWHKYSNFDLHLKQIIASAKAFLIWSVVKNHMAWYSIPHLKAKPDIIFSQSVQHIMQTITEKQKILQAFHNNTHRGEL